ncbi:Sialate O-acetylesterase [Croceitalea dokdonensis DOKDO 023]|uniref:Sialate O-acetylesterase n=1 Tax=Croceitalea dokdonensis DOKDO 023 TaxID=1300341 RepID=A0A0P7AWS5_9FLAO|nr:sialate O-acetylesterase [Croceitalea dokdonensis]KPM30786.1 Sialate O-acetylesterase [Croceitalea dokdonensis DOKDO 023]
MKENTCNRYAKNRHTLVGFVWFVFFFGMYSSVAQVRLPSFFSEDMVLQQQDSVPIWGWDMPNTKLNISTSWGEKVHTETNETGKWKVLLPTPKASFTVHDIVIKGSTSIALKNVLIGEVWFCSGQSNMEMPMKGLGNSPVENASAFLKQATNPHIRLFNTERAGSLKPNNNVMGRWAEADSTSVSNFSAIGYLFGKKLFQKLNVPIGIIEAAWGGTRIEAWLPKKVAEQDDNISLPDALPEEANKRKLPTLIYNGMVHPFQDLTIRGVLWYQGETNRTNPEPYKRYLHYLVKAWRSQWQNHELPFYMVQIAPYAYEKYRNTEAIKAALIREAQLLASQEIPHTGLVVTSDVGHCSDIHPPKKEPIAERLSFWALHHQYGYKDVTYASPVLGSQKTHGEKMELYFKFPLNGTDAQVTSFGKSLMGFEIAGADKVFYQAKAQVSKEGFVTVSSTKVVKPIAVRYGFVDCFQGNLYGISKLPVSPFRTDSW